MSKILWKSLLVSPASLGATLVVAATSMLLAHSAPAAAATQFSTAAADLQKPTSVSANDSVAVAAKTSVASATEQQQDATQAKTIAAQPEETQIAQAAPANNSAAPADADSRNLQQIQRYSNEGTAKDPTLGQVTNASQFRDVQPSDWAYEALDRIVQKYGCLVGYPDGTYRGNRALSRYEFAAGLNACLRQIETLISNQPQGVSRSDFESLQRLSEEFRTELATLGTRVDNLEGRTAFLENRQFSTTTKLAGEAILAVTDSFGRDDKNNTVFGDRVRLDLRSSFTGRDTLHTRLAAGNLAAFGIGSPQTGPLNFGGTTTAEGTQTFNIAPNTSNGIALDWLGYYFPFGASKVYLTATGGTHSDYAATNNPYFEDYDGGNGALSTFAQENPIYRIGGGAGGAISFGVGRPGSLLGPTSLTLGYLASNANNPANANTVSPTGFNGGGLLNGSYSALGQLNFSVSDAIGVGLTYVHGYHVGGSDIFDLGGSSGQNQGIPVVGTLEANNPRLGAASGIANAFGAASPLIATALGAPLHTNSYGASVAIRPSRNFSLSGFVTKTSARITGVGDADVWSYGGGIALPNFGKEGNVLGLFAGIEPTLTGLRVGGNFVNFGRRDNAYHLEGFYKYQLTDNISVTPGVIWLTNPGQDATTPNAFVGTLRTTFTF